jgi:hypothetical protein
MTYEGMGEDRPSNLATIFQKWVDQRREEVDKHFELFNKQMEPINKLANESFSQFSSILQTAEKEISERTIEIKVQGEASSRYITNITDTGSIINQFPTEMPAPNDLYWMRHTQLVDKVIADKQATIDKIVDTIGATIKGVINPISSMALSPNDLVQLIDTFRVFLPKT